MKIMLIIGAITFGGAERVMVNLANYLSKNNEVVLCTLYERQMPYAIDNTVILKQGFASKGSLSSFSRIRRYAIKYRPDVVLSFLSHVNITTIIALLGTGIPVVVSERNDPKYEPAQWYRKILRALTFPFARGYVFQTNDAKDYFNKKIKDRAVVIPNPVFVDEKLCKEHVEEPAYEYVAAGRLTPQKNYPLMIEAFAKASKVHPEFVLKIYGDGEEREKLETLVKSFDATKNIIFLGASKNLHQQIKDSYGFLMTSDHEGMPNALLEAMSLGLCCISTDCPCGGPREIITNGENGLLIPVGDVESLYESLIITIENEAFANRLRVNAMKIREIYDWEKIGKQWEDYLKKIATEKKKMY